MTGQEHYKQAARLISSAEMLSDTGAPYYVPDDAATIAAAQVHATLALAAATERVAADEDRIAGTVDESGTRLRIGAMPV